MLLILAEADTEREEALLLELQALAVLLLQLLRDEEARPEALLLRQELLLQLVNAEAEASPERLPVEVVEELAPRLSEGVGDAVRVPVLLREQLELKEGDTEEEDVLLGVGEKDAL